jgi:SAM-dependent methyltransferase
MKNVLTTKYFWKTYWSTQSIIRKVKKNIYFADLLKSASENLKGSEFIEIGGFPGNYPIYVHKYLKLNATLLDYLYDKNIVTQLMAINGIDTKDIIIIDEDFFTFKSKKKYDLVFSSGFIEHFIDTQQVIKKHVDLLKKDGKLIITLPNFLGLNGFIQKLTVNSFYRAHNLKAMDMNYLLSILNKMKLRNIQVRYYGYFGIWLEDFNKYPLIIKIIFYAILSLRIPFRWLNINNKLFSPHIVIKADKI